MPEFKNISPQVLTEFVSFYRDKDKTHLLFKEYSQKSMQAKQAEGAAFLFNLLNEKGLALLADEVGMGKTIQSLAVASALWQQKPDARILVLAPRNEVAQNWISEYETFVKVHYKAKDDIVKSRIDGKPINQAIFCTNLYDLTSEVQKKWGKFYIGKISSFSSLYSQEDISNRLVNINLNPDGICNNNDSIEQKQSVRKIANLMREDILKSMGGKPFDLLIIDEAHYFRNKNGGSLRVNVAEEFFNQNENKIAKRTLLLTATPNHSSSENIKAMTSYFDDGAFNDLNYKEILDAVCLRRFRRLSKQGKIKYNYREELPRESDFKNDKMSELLFGIYQKQLVSEYMDGSQHGGRRNILGFLEGTEFIPQERIKIEEDPIKENREGDFTVGTDGQILANLASKFQSVFKKAPSHPKYELLIEDLIDKNTIPDKPNSKKLVFVRRIPSVKEIAARSLLKYDELLLQKIQSAWKKEFDLSIHLNDFRSHFEEQIGSLDDFVDNDTSEEETENDENLSSIPISKVMYLFKTLKKKDGVLSSTHASKFRLRFTRSRPSIFNVFFVPPADYFDKPYEVEIYKSELKGKGFIEDYYLSCLKQRTSSKAIHDDERMKVLTTLGGHMDNIQKTEETKKIKTLLNLFWEYLDQHEIIGFEKDAIRSEYKRFSVYQKEALCMFIEKGVLLASSGLVDLYVAFIRASSVEDKKAYELYQSFILEVEQELPNSGIPELIASSILNFRVLCEKVFNISTSSQLLNEEWKNFWDAQPAYAYSGHTKNQRVMASFNTPFYPDVLISTSVLQEGVNLQYFCDKIIHYGVAWTPGDNEQRVGRIDRMFSKIERELDRNSNCKLDIIYPYLKNTIDQDHVANFISNKYLAENLIDYCQAFEGNNQLDPKNFNPENWQQYFRKPNNETADDPYPVKFNTLDRANYKWTKTQIDTDIRDQIINTFKSKNVPVYESSFSSDTICILDPIITENNVNRHQPVVVKINHAPQLTGVLDETVYSLSLITPIGTKKERKRFEANYNKFRTKYEDEYMTVKFCLDVSQNANSIFGIYARVDLPVFIDNKERPLSIDELLQNYDDLINCADFIERIVLESDLKLSSIESNKKDIGNSKSSGLLSHSRINHNYGNQWKSIEDFIFLEKPMPNSDLGLKSSWELNHHNIYAKYLNDKVIVPYYNIDVQKVEINALEAVFEMTTQGMKK